MKVQVQRVAHLNNMDHIPTMDGSSNIKLNSMKTKVLKITTKILKYKIEFMFKI